MEQFIPDLAGLLGLDSTTTLMLWLVLMLVANTISKLIPEDATGVRRIVRRVASIIGVHVKNRVHEKITPEGMTQAFIVEAERHAKTRLQDGVDQVKDVIRVPAEFEAYLQNTMPPPNETDHAR